MAAEDEATVRLTADTAQALAEFRKFSSLYQGIMLQLADATAKGTPDEEFDKLKVAAKAALDGVRSSAKVAGDSMRTLAVAMRDGTTATDGQTKAARAQTGEVDKLSRAYNKLTSSLAALGFGKLVKDSVDAALQLQGLEIQLRAVEGSAEGGADAFGFVRSEAERLGLPIFELADGFAKLSVAAKGTKLEGGGIKDVFSAILEASRVLHLSNAKTELSLYAVQQMLSKGKVSTEELVRQLGDNLPGAMQIAARATGFTTAELIEMLKGGKLLSEDFLPKFAAEIRRTFGPGLAEAIHGAQAELQRFSNDLLIIKAKFAGGFLKELAADSAEGRAALRDGGKAAAEFGRAAGFLLDKLGLLLKFWPALSAAVGAGSSVVISAISGILKAVALLNEGLAKTAAKVPGFDLIAEAGEKAAESLRSGPIAALDALADGLKTNSIEKWESFLNRAAKTAEKAAGAIQSVGTSGADALDPLPEKAEAAGKAIGDHIAAGAEKAKQSLAELEKAQREALEAGGAGFFGSKPSDVESLSKQRDQLQGTVDALKEKQDQGALTSEELASLTQAEDDLASVNVKLKNATHDVAVAMQTQAQAAEATTAPLDAARDVLSRYGATAVEVSTKTQAAGSALTSGATNAHDFSTQLEGLPPVAQQAAQGIGIVGDASKASAEELDNLDAAQRAWVEGAADAIGPVGHLTEALAGFAARQHDGIGASVELAEAVGKTADELARLKETNPVAYMEEYAKAQRVCLQLQKDLNAELGITKTLWGEIVALVHESESAAA